MKKNLLKLIARFSYNYYRSIILVSILITAISAFFALKLNLTTEVIDLLPQDSPVVKSFNSAMERYGSMDYLIVVVEDATGGEVENREDFVDALADEFRSLKSVKYVDYKIDDRIRSFYRETFYDYALLYLSADELQKIREKLSGTSILNQMKLNRESLRTAVSAASKELIIRDPLNMRDIFDDHISTAKGRLKIHFKDGYYFSEDLTMLIMLVKPNQPAQDMNFVKMFLNDVKAAEQRTRMRFEDSYDTRVGYTGNYAIAESYTGVIKKDIILTFLTSFIGVMLLFLFTFRRLASIFYVGIPLVMAVLWTLCLSYLYIGNLNIVTSAFCAILIGLGVDFAIHLFNKFSAEKASGKDDLESLELALTETGDGIITAALTTAFAFFALTVSGFRGLSELGFMTGCGIILCLVSMFVVFPALLTFRGKYPIAMSKFRKIPNFGLEILAEFIEKNRKKVIFACLVLTLILGSAAFFIKFDDDFKNLRPKGSEPIKLQERLVEKIGSPLNYTLVLAKGDSVENVMLKGDEVVKRINKLIKMKSVLSFNSLRKFIPSKDRQQANLGWLNRVRIEEPDAMSFERIENDFTLALGECGFKSKEPFKESLANIEKALGVKKEITLDDLMESGIGDLVSRFFYTGTNEYELATYVYPTHEDSKEAVSQIISEMKDIDDVEVIGVKVLSTELKRIVEEDAFLAAFIALSGVFCFLVYHFRKMKLVGMAILPLLMSVIWMVGTMSLFRLKFNLMNISILPIIIGIGIDDGIHIVHHYLEDAHRDIINTAKITGRAVVMTSLTTIVGFGSLMFANYPGLASVGVVAILGVTYSLIASITILPALLSLWDREI